MKFSPEDFWGVSQHSRGEFNVGDIVKVVDSGGCFRTYPGLLDDMGYSKYRERYKTGELIPLGIYKVIGTGIDASDRDVCVLEDTKTKQVYLMICSDDYFGKVYIKHHKRENRDY